MVFLYVTQYLCEVTGCIFQFKLDSESKNAQNRKQKNNMEAFEPLSQLYYSPKKHLFPDNFLFVVVAHLHLTTATKKIHFASKYLLY